MYLKLVSRIYQRGLIDLSIIIVIAAIVLWMFKELLDSEERCRKCIAYRYIVFSLLILWRERWNNQAELDDLAEHYARERVEIKEQFGQYQAIQEINSDNSNHSCISEFQ